MIRPIYRFQSPSIFVGCALLISITLAVPARSQNKAPSAGTLPLLTTGAGEKLSLLSFRMSGASGGTPASNSSDNHGEKPKVEAIIIRFLLAKGDRDPLKGSRAPRKFKKLTITSHYNNTTTKIDLGDALVRIERVAKKGDNRIVDASIQYATISVITL